LLEQFVPALHLAKFSKVSYQRPHQLNIMARILGFQISVSELPVEA